MHAVFHPYIYIITYCLNEGYLNTHLSPEPQKKSHRMFFNSQVVIGSPPCGSTQTARAVLHIAVSLCLGQPQVAPYGTVPRWVRDLLPLFPPSNLSVSSVWTVGRKTGSQPPSPSVTPGTKSTNSW